LLIVAGHDHTSARGQAGQGQPNRAAPEGCAECSHKALERGTVRTALRW
jgi:hypothetical protein